MSHQQHVIFASDEAWQVATTRGDEILLRQVPPQAGVAADQIAPLVRAALDELGYDGGGVILALPSAWCLAASVDTKGLSRKARSSALLYRLEEQLPLAAEEIAADFAAPAEGRAMGVAVQAQRLMPLVQGLESNGIAVDLICPAALLALAFWGRSHPDSIADTLAWRSNHQIDCFGLCQQRPLSWRLLPADSAALAQALGMQGLQVDRDLRVLLLDLGPCAAQIQQMPGRWTIEAADGSLLEAAVRGGCGALAGTLQPPVNLRQGPLAATDPLRQVRKPMTSAMAAAALGLLVLGLSMLLRANRYAQLAGDAQLQQMQAYRQAMPAKDVPIDATLLLQTELRRLKALSGDAASLPPGHSALSLLREALIPLPKDLRYRVLELRIEPARLQMDGQARSHGDAETIAAALRRAGSFEPEPPRSEQRGESGESGVSFTIVAAVKPPPASGQRPTP